MNLANKSWNQLHNNIMRVSDGRLHAVANTAYQARVSGITGFRMDSFTPGGHSLPTDFTVNCLWIHFVVWGLSSSVVTNLWANWLEID